MGVQEQGSSNPGALLQQLQAAQASPRQQALLLGMLQESALGAAAREPLTNRVHSELLAAMSLCTSAAAV